MSRTKSSIAVVLTTAAAFAGLAAQASADPVATVCGSVKVTINGEAVVDQAQCRSLPPEAH
jgi:type 1 fimbria pilin